MKKVDFGDKDLAPFLKNAVSEAIALIQQRIEGASKGMLSVEESADIEGALSKNETDEKGKLSNVEE